MVKGFKKCGVKFEPGAVQKLSTLNSTLSDLFSVVQLGDLTKGDNIVVSLVTTTYFKLDY